MAISQVISWIVYCLYFHRSRVGFLVLTLFICIGVYLATPLVLSQHWRFLSIVSDFSGNLIPALIWLLAQKFFSDNVQIPRLFYVVTGTYLCLMLAPQDLQEAISSSASFQLLVFFFVPQALKLSLVLHVIYLALSERNADLVEQRLQMRVPFAITFALTISAVILVEISFSSDVPVYVVTFGSIVFFILTLAGTAFGMRLRPELAAIATTAVFPKPKQLAIENPVIHEIQQLMKSRRFYANYDVTLDLMAQQLRLPAYKLRPIINQQMGFKNFNQFLNSFRVNEASERLLTEASSPILTIALDSGFKSLSAFNKAFKDTHGMTPSEYRKRNIG
jgi:AraC-like DNA-binding protein